MRIFLWALVLAWSAAACAVETLPIATRLHPDASDDDRIEDDAGAAEEQDARAAVAQDGGGGGRASCARNDDCESDEYCDLRSCGDSRGSCRARPSFCNADNRPVCGCDGLNYFNACLARQRGVVIAREDACEQAIVCGGRSGAVCPGENSQCARLARFGATCSTDTPGACWVMPTECGPRRGGGDVWRVCDGSGPGRGGGGQGGGGPGPGTMGPPQEGCVDTCAAILSGLPHVVAERCEDN